MAPAIPAKKPLSMSDAMTGSPIERRGVAKKVKTPENKKWKNLPSLERRRRIKAWLDIIGSEETSDDKSIPEEWYKSTRILGRQAEHRRRILKVAIQTSSASSLISNQPPRRTHGYTTALPRDKKRTRERLRSPSKRTSNTRVKAHDISATMSSTFTSLRGLATRLFAARPSPSSLLTKPSPVVAVTGLQQQQTASYASKGGKSGPPPGMFTRGPATGKKNKGPKQMDPRIINILRHFAVLSPKRIPPPLRFGRNRYLRHWTIHRAWLLFRRQQREQRERILMQQYQSMSNACEELRNTEGPGTRETGYLYRIAMQKHGVYGFKSIPIEYAGRALVETPAKQAWNHEWTR
ncbi:hypothetical protein B0T20DRAFT_461166 [Sordaria brevicollis]|uniref:Large ribosomal subunit protein mL40 n=1 Tax=Sordaria brevicollis TaxID=83679 RepID=A0AAE0PEE1_SORBR|nr:hypothetical protein B0T20DRAFT_461166 [Sordaria brevicollis]